MFNPTSRGFSALLSATLACGLSTTLSAQQNAAIHFDNVTAEAGLLHYSPTFSLVVSDVDGDRDDDIFIGNHARPPLLYLNSDGQFSRTTGVIPIDDHDDRHGFLFVDLDNDGDRDFVYAGGGADGIGAGTANAVFSNQLKERGQLIFEPATETYPIALPEHRSRAFLPVPGAAGAKVDLYLTSLHRRRAGSTNFYAKNSSSPGSVRLAIDLDYPLNLPIESDGKDLFFDFDRDGDMDYLRIGHARAHLFRNNGGRFDRQPSNLDRLRLIVSAVPADLDNNGFPDLFLGTYSPASDSDYLSSNDQEIHFSTRSQPADEGEQISFRSTGDKIHFDLIEWVPDLGRARSDTDDIFIGSAAADPKYRKRPVSRAIARGKPASFERPGTYLWFDPARELWHIRWQHDPEQTTHAKGVISGENIELVDSQDLEQIPSESVTDFIAFNNGGLDWEIQELEGLRHKLRTNHATAADFNNDGRVDIVGLRAGQEAQANGVPFVLINHGSRRFSAAQFADTPEDDIFRADLIAHGFFNDDTLADIVYTNGYGLMPSDKGPYQLLFNRSNSGFGGLLLELEGTTANRDAIGAQLELYDRDDVRMGYRELGSGWGRAQDSHKVHFGLGDSAGPYRLRIRWPGEDTGEEHLLGGAGYYRIVQAAVSRDPG